MRWRAVLLARRSLRTPRRRHLRRRGAQGGRSAGSGNGGVQLPHARVFELLEERMAHAALGGSLVSTHTFLDNAELAAPRAGERDELAVREGSGLALEKPRRLAINVQIARAVAPAHRLHAVVQEYQLNLLPRDVFCIRRAVELCAANNDALASGENSALAPLAARRQTSFDASLLALAPPGTRQHEAAATAEENQHDCDDNDNPAARVLLRRLGWW